MVNQHSWDIHQKIVELIDAGRSFAVGVILKADGSTPGKVGGKAIIEADGRIWGTLGGGQVEALAQQRAVEACKTGKAIVFDFAFEGVSAAADKPVCGGAMKILIDPNANANRGAYGAAAEAFGDLRRGVMLTRICGERDISVDNEWVGEERIVAGGGDGIAEAVGKCLKKETAQLVAEDGTRWALIEPVVLRPVLLIAGGGHVGQAVAAQANMVGFDVIVLDDRAEFARSELFVEGVRTMCGDVAAEIEGYDITEDTYIVIVTRGHQHDVEALRACIRSGAGYIGMIGSRRKVAVIRADIVESGFASEAQFDRVFAPIGVDIGAVTVPEIATSIVAQLIAVRRKGAGHEVGNMVKR